MIVNIRSLSQYHVTHTKLDELYQVYNKGMCGRYSLDFDKEFYKRYKTTNKPDIKAHYNVAPSQTMPVITAHSPNVVEMMVWGLVPFWEEKNAKPKGLINVRDDTIKEKHWANKYLTMQRCLVPTTGFYEWKKTGDGKVPFYIHLKDRKYFSFAGMYSIWKHPQNGEEIKTFTIITTSPNHTMSLIHNRMPVILHEKDEDDWLNPDNVEKEQLARHLRTYPDREMEAYPISTRVNSPSFDDPSLVHKSS